MAEIFSNNTFTYNGQTYFFQATLFTKTDKYFSMHSLDSDECSMFEYWNQMNSLTIPAALTYEDRYGVVDKYLEKPFVQCRITFAEVDVKAEDEVVARTLNQEAILNLDFVVSNIEILKREGTIVFYKIHMVSSNWMNLSSRITYSNYGKDKKQVFKIIQDILKLAQLDVDQTTFDLVQSDVKLNYITNGNDTVSSCIKYLLSMLMYYKQRDKVWKFIYYDEWSHSYKLFDITNFDTYNGNRTFLLSLFNSSTEQLLQIEPLDINTVTSFTNLETFKTGFDCKTTDYDYMHNVFVEDVIKNEDIVNVRNTTFAGSEYLQKYEKVYDTTLDFSRDCNYWNDDILVSQYNFLSRTFCENNSIVITCAGDITRKPSDLVTISLDREVAKLSDEDPEKADDIKHKYAGFEGCWITSKVHHFVDIKNSTYRAKVMAFRNFITDTIEESAK